MNLDSATILNQLKPCHNNNKSRDKTKPSNQNKRLRSSQNKTLEQEGGTYDVMGVVWSELLSKAVILKKICFWAFVANWTPNC